MKFNIEKRLDYLRKELRSERISTDELLELQSYIKHIDPSDVELLEAAGVSEFPEQNYEIKIIGAGTRENFIESLQDLVEALITCKKMPTGDIYEDDFISVECDETVLK